MLKNLKVSHGLFAVLMILTLVQMISSCWNIYSYNKNERNTVRIANNYLRINELNEAYALIASTRSQLWKLSFMMANGTSTANDLKQITELKNNYLKADQNIKRFMELSATTGGADFEHAQIISKLYEEVKQIQLNNMDELEKHDLKSMAAFTGNRNPAGDLLNKITKTNNFINEHVLAPTLKQARSMVTQAIAFSVVITAICLIFTLFSLFWSKRYIINKINKLLFYQATMAQGDLSIPIHVDGKNEIDNLIKGLADLQDSLSETIRSVSSGSGHIYSSVQEIVAGNNDLSSRTEEQASALEQTAASMEQLTSTIKNSTENARQVAAMSVTSENLAQEGGELTQRMVTTMEQITESSQKINEIIGVIDGIAFQTNILALNAAVEAARAGTHGQGFAVVAAEVRNLALRSADAAKEIKSLINTSVAHVQAGNTLTSQVDQTIRKMMDAAASAATTLEEIFRASEEQSRGIEQISLAISEMDTVTQQNASLVEESAAATASLEDQIKHLNQIVGFFKINNESAHHHLSGGKMNPDHIQHRSISHASLGYHG